MVLSTSSTVNSGTSSVPDLISLYFPVWALFGYRVVYRNLCIFLDFFLCLTRSFQIVSSCSLLFCFCFCLLLCLLTCLRPFLAFSVSCTNFVLFLLAHVPRFFFNICSVLHTLPVCIPAEPINCKSLIILISFPVNCSQYGFHTKSLTEWLDVIFIRAFAQARGRTLSRTHTTHMRYTHTHDHTNSGYESKSSVWKKRAFFPFLHPSHTYTRALSLSL